MSDDPPPDLTRTADLPLGGPGIPPVEDDRSTSADAGPPNLFDEARTVSLHQQPTAQPASTPGPSILEGTTRPVPIEQHLA
ncbi:MAG: hypothetical protein AAF547_22825, partial [Actinomycetota bacterium]